MRRAGPFSHKKAAPKLPKISQKTVKRVQFSLSQAESNSTNDDSCIPKKNLLKVIEGGLEEEDDVDITQIEFEIPMRLQKTSCYDKSQTQKDFAVSQKRSQLKSPKFDNSDLKINRNNSIGKMNKTCVSSKRKSLDSD